MVTGQTWVNPTFCQQESLNGLFALKNKFDIPPLASSKSCFLTFVCGQGFLGGNAAILVYCFKCSGCVSLSLGSGSIQIQPQVTAKQLHLQEDKVGFFLILKTAIYFPPTC